MNRPFGHWDFNHCPRLRDHSFYLALFFSTVFFVVLVYMPIGYSTSLLLHIFHFESKKNQTVHCDSSLFCSIKLF